MKKITTVALSIALALGVASCSNSSVTAENNAVVQTQTGLSSGIELANMDTSVAPQQDFFHYVNGSWMEKTEIPGDKARWGSFDELRENAEKQVFVYLEHVEKQLRNNFSLRISQNLSKKVKTNMSKDKIKLEYIAILSNFLPINLLGIINM